MERWGVRGTAHNCDLCGFLTDEVWVCSACYRAGHPGCLGVQLLEGYAFCSECHPWAVTQHQRLTTEAAMQRWSERLTGQLANWRAITMRMGAHCTFGNVAQRQF